MYKLVVLSGLLAVALAKPSTLVSPVIGKLVSEKTIESHGSSVVHASAPVISPAIPLVNAVEHVVPVAPVVPVKTAAIVSEKTIEAHGHSIVHHSAPAAAISYVAPATPVVATAPVIVAQAKEDLEKSEKTQKSSEKSESPQQSKELIKKIETIVLQSNQVQSQQKTESSSKLPSESLQRNETAQNKAYTGITESHGQFIIHEAAPAVLTYQAAPLTNILATPYVFPAEIPSFAYIPRKHVADFSLKAGSTEKLQSPEPEQQSAEKLKPVEHGAIHEVATGLHLAAPSVYYYPYPAAVVAEKSISSYGHSIIHGA